MKTYTWIGIMVIAFMVIAFAIVIGTCGTFVTTCGPAQLSSTEILKKEFAALFKDHFTSAFHLSGHYTRYVKGRDVEHLGRDWGDISVKNNIITGGVNAHYCGRFMKTNKTYSYPGLHLDSTERSLRINAMQYDDPAASGVLYARYVSEDPNGKDARFWG